LWDYIKGVGKLEVRQIVNLSKLMGFLIASGDIPLHFLKVVNFDESPMDKPLVLFLHLLLERVFEVCKDKDQVISVFSAGLLHQDETKMDNNKEFAKGMSQYLLSKFYSRVKS